MAPVVGIAGGTGELSRPVTPKRGPWGRMPQAVRVSLIIVAVFGLAAVSFLTGRYVGLGEGARRAQVPGGGPDGGVLPPAPQVHRLSDGATVSILARGYADWPFELRPPERECRLTVHVVGVEGGRKDVQVLVLTDDDFRNWSTGHEFRAVWQSGIAAAVTTDLPVRVLGLYRLVVSNQFSLVTPKTATVSADLSCPPR